MGLDANVMCNCFLDGKTIPPPFPSDWLEVDRDGYINIKPDHDSDDNWMKQCDWEQSCCEHNRMNFATEHIANWAGYRLFQAALEDIGWQHFPVLKEQLPNSNGGLTPADASAKAILELEFFNSVGEIGRKTVLVDTSSGERLYEHVAAYDGVFIWSGSQGVKVGLGEFDLFAVDAETGNELFRATKFRQFKSNGSMVSDDDHDIIWEDLDTGKICETGTAIPGKQIPWEDGSWQKPGGKCRFEYPPTLHVEQQPRFAADFDDTVRSLRRIFDASVATGNPVRWC